MFWWIIEAIKQSHGSQQYWIFWGKYNSEVCTCGRGLEALTVIASRHLGHILYALCACTFSTCLWILWNVCIIMYLFHVARWLLWILAFCKLAIDPRRCQYLIGMVNYIRLSLSLSPTPPDHKDYICWWLLVLNSVQIYIEKKKDCVCDGNQLAWTCPEMWQDSADLSADLSQVRARRFT